MIENVSVLGQEEGYTMKYGLSPRKFPRAQPEGTPTSICRPPHTRTVWSNIGGAPHREQGLKVGRVFHPQTTLHQVRVEPAPRPCWTLIHGVRPMVYRILIGSMDSGCSNNSRCCFTQSIHRILSVLRRLSPRS